MRNYSRAKIKTFGLLLNLFCVLLSGGSVFAGQQALLNASFDVSRQLFEQINPAFIESWRVRSGEQVTINQSHAGSSTQARAVIDGLKADVVTLNQPTDIDTIATKGGLISTNWAQLFPGNSAPYFSTIVFLVRKGNPKGIKDWNDLIKPGVAVIVPNPKTSGNGRYSYLGAYAFALKQPGGDDAKARSFVTALFKNVPVLDSGGRGATTTFAKREIGDVLLTFESEALLIAKDLGTEKAQVVWPTESIVADMPVAVVEKVVKQHGTEKLARGYLEFLYSEPAQEIIAQNYYRPRSKVIAEKHAGQFGDLKLLTVQEVFGSWPDVQRTHFADGGVYDQISNLK